MTSDQCLALAEAPALRARHALYGKVRRAEESMTLDELLACLQAREKSSQQGPQ
jgi:hypothetical protein